MVGAADILGGQIEEVVLGKVGALAEGVISNLHHRGVTHEELDVVDAVGMENRAVARANNLAEDHEGVEVTVRIDTVQIRFVEREERTAVFPNVVFAHGMFD